MRILIADAQPKVRFALRVLLERQSGLFVVGEATDTESLMTQVKAIHPDLVLLGWELPGLSVASSLPALRRFCPSLLVIGLSGRPEARQAALAAGVDAFVSKSDPPDCLLETIAISGSCSPDDKSESAKPLP